jgi:hypothetical protein
MRFLRLLPLLCLTLAPAARAQIQAPLDGFASYLNTRGGPMGYATSPEDYGLTVHRRIDSDDGTAITVASVRAGTLGAFAASRHLAGSASAGIATLREVTFHRERGDAAVQRLELYLDGIMTGPVAPGRVAGCSEAAGQLKILVFDWQQSRYHDRQINACPDPRTGGEGGFIERQATFIELPLSPGANRFMVWASLAASGRFDWVADFSHTARLFAPPTDGVRMQTTGGFLAEQARPSWAATSTTAPEPGTLALVGGGLLATLGLAGRRRPAGRGPGR